MFTDRALLPLLIVGVLFAYLAGSASTAEPPNIEGKVVLANLDRYDAVLRFGETRREIKPKKASILSPKDYPVTIEFWSGNTTAGWRKQTIAAAGVYGFNFTRGNWTLTELKKGTTARPATTPSRAVLQQRVVRRPVARGPINASRYRWSPLARVAWFAGSIYQFVRDEEDRDLLRELLIRGREEDLRDFERWLDESDKIALPHKEELKDAYEQLKELSDDDWKEIETADDQAWDLAKTELGDLISTDEWQNLTNDFADISTNDFWEDNVDVDLDQIDFADNLDVDGNIDIGDDLDLSEDFDVGNLGIGTGNYDLGGFDDFGGFDGAYDVGPGDFGVGDIGGGFDGGGGFGDGGFIGDNDFGDFGGFDDFDFGGGDFDF